MTAFSQGIDINQDSKTDSQIDSQIDSLIVRGMMNLLSPGPTFDLYATATSGRHQVEQYIADQFCLRYGARISDFMPVLLTMSCQGVFSAAAGIRPAGNQSLYLEQYLPLPVDKMLSQLAGQPVPRNRIAEIGNLAATRRGASLLLFLILSGVLRQTDFEWLVFTATTQVQKTIKRLGVQLHTLGDASPALLQQSSAASWGSYYDNQPRVVAGRLPDAMTKLHQQKLFAPFFLLYQSRIDTLAAAINHQKPADEQHAVAA